MQISDELLKKCVEQDRRAQFELYNLCYGILMSISSRYEKNKEDAEALVNLGFLKVVTKIDTYSTSIPFEAWIRRIMINTVIDEYRKRKKEQDTIQYTDFEDQYVNKSVDYNDAAEQFEAEELEIMIRSLPEVTQKVFNLHVIDGFSHNDISEMLGMSTGTSKWHVNNARKILKQKIAARVDASNHRMPI